jgi:hypothetical protein
MNGLFSDAQEAAAQRKGSVPAIAESLRIVFLELVLLMSGIAAECDRVTLLL